MSEASVFLAAYLGTITGLLSLLVPLGYLIKKKMKNSMIGGMM